MVFVTTYFTFWDGLAPGAVDPVGYYCVNDTSSPDYGTCTVMVGKARFVQTDTATYPTGSLPCEKQNTCVRFTNTMWNRTLYVLFDYGTKQAIFTRFSFRTHGAFTFPAAKVAYLEGSYIASPIEDYAYSVFFPSVQYEVNQWPVYIPTINLKAYFNPYTIRYGSVVVVEWAGSILTSRLYVGVYEGNRNNTWYMASGLVTWSYESSPLAVIPLDYYRYYAPYRELRSAFGYSATGVDQPGWNADDIIRVLRELFPDRAWAVFDDRRYMLYLYNLTPDYVPDWLIDKLSPTAMKVLKAPSDASVAEYWLDELNRRNGYNQTPVKTV